MGVSRASTYNAGTSTEAAIMRGEVAAEQSRRVFVLHSDDDGATWSAPAEVTATAKRADWRWYATGPGHAVRLTRGPYRGRLVVPANHSARPARRVGRRRHRGPVLRRARPDQR